LKGIYVLIIRVNKDIHVNIGALKREKRLFWHIDYLLANNAAETVKVLYKQGDKTEECKTATRIGENGTPIAGFGCSDCHCTSHLFRIADYTFLLDSMQPLNVFS
jgi:Uri superfamily endonuclease